MEEPQVIVRLSIRCHDRKASAILSSIEDYARRFDCIVESAAIGPVRTFAVPAEPPEEVAVSTADLKGRAPQEVFERLTGETEAEFSARMARVQSQLAEEQRRRRTAPTLNPIDAFKGVFNQ